MAWASNKKALNNKWCPSAGDVLWNYSTVCYLSPLWPKLSPQTHTGTGMCGAPLSNYHAKWPDLSRALSDVTRSALVTSVPCCCTPDKTNRLSWNSHSQSRKHALSTFCPPQKQSTALSPHLANDALIVQVNKLAIFSLSLMNNKDFAPSLLLFVCCFFSLLFL